jgi:tetratricopeptide (TPR) repeat protein
LALGRLEMASGHAAQAAIWLTKAVELLPDGDAQKTATLLELGAAHLAAGNLNEAADAWEKTAVLAPTDLALRRQLADTYTRNRLGSRAIPHLEFIVKRGQPQDRAQALQQMAAIYQAQGEQDAAIRATESALAYTAPGNWLRGELQAQLIRLHQRYHRTAELETKWKKYAEENPRDRGAYLQLIDFYERIGDRQQQLVWLEKLVQAAPKENEYRLKLARLLAEMDQLDRAASLYDELLGSQPRNIELVFERARIDVQRDQPQVAGDRIAALLERTGNDEGVRAKALEFYQANRLRDLAEKHLREEAKSQSDDAIVALANFLFTNHREAEARETLNRLVRESDPQEKQACCPLSHRRSAQVAERRKPRLPQQFAGLSTSKPTFVTITSCSGNSRPPPGTMPQPRSPSKARFG